MMRFTPADEVMRFITPDNLKFLLSRFHIRPDEKLGQNFLVDTDALDKILSAAALTPADLVVEIGAGVGTLTQALCARAGQVIAVEKDRRLIKLLRFALHEFANVQIVNCDILQLDILKLLAADYPHFSTFKIVANIPYYITGKILENVFVLKRKPKLIVLLVQREVGERVCAKPGQMSALSVAAQVYSRPEIVGVVLRQSFFPPPEVDSVILKLQPRENFAVAADQRAFFRLVKLGFAHRRKTLENNLAAGLRLAKPAAAALLQSAGLPSAVRAQELAIEDWARLLQVLDSVKAM
jgi:16S rRNA (adenine1518-N6/adenine1519-N6)-dimethyltransferase